MKVTVWTDRRPTINRLLDRQPPSRRTSLQWFIRSRRRAAPRRGPLRSILIDDMKKSQTHFPNKMNERANNECKNEYRVYVMSRNDQSTYHICTPPSFPTYSFHPFFLSFPRDCKKKWAEAVGRVFGAQLSDAVMAILGDWQRSEGGGMEAISRSDIPLDRRSRRRRRERKRRREE